MYPFASVRWAWDALWEALRERVDWLPAKLAHSGDVQARWDDPDCVVNHVCGWPLARWHADDHRVLGAFSITIPEADGCRYRSTIVSPHDVPLADLVAADVRVEKDGVSVGGTSIMGLMMLAASPGCCIRVTADGEQAAEVMNALGSLIAARFGEEI